MFKDFADVPIAELGSNKKLLGHALSVMYALNSIVDNLNDVESLIQVLQKTGESHQPRKISGYHFQNLAVVVINLLKEALGPSLMDATAEEAWRKTLEVANSIIIQALGDTNKET
ncbi:GLOBIN domain-containing protein [Caerostris extrusa]|uniref:GLOBIN domain-containing protein n=1 Tax=Caerostris extrusa TaxID=172846 RepID=A0AAV4RSW6_CAEEX|nr:GLOBIN domain-containing protein [Caerostris extrusa]